MNEQLHTKAPCGGRLGSATPWQQGNRLGPVPYKTLHPGEHLLHAGQYAKVVYAVQSGSLKSYTVDDDGSEQLLGIHGKGDWVGLDALLGRAATCSVAAIDVSAVEVLRFPDRDPELEAKDEVTRVILEAMYREILRFARLALMERRPSERRLAVFLLEFSEHQQQRSLNHTKLKLPIGRRDLACYLGLAPETLSRTFSVFQAKNILQVNNRDIAILDLDALRSIAGTEIPTAVS